MKLNDFRNKWSPAVGSKGATYQFVATRLLGFGGLGVAVWGLALGIGISAHNHELRIFAYVLMGIDGSVILAGFLALYNAARAMSLFLGLRIPTLQVPTLKDETFKRWCAERGLNSPGHTTPP